MSAEWYTPAEVAKFHRVGKSVIYRAIRLGELPAYQVGRQFRISPEAAKNFAQPVGAK
ncbi:MAG: helix-turn-helix domain-containing protein [Pseudonocardiaceae bacterium]